MYVKAMRMTSLKIASVSLSFMTNLNTPPTNIQILMVNLTHEIGTLLTFKLTRRFQNVFFNA